LYPDATLSSDRVRVHLAIQWFDHDFAEAAERGGGIEKSREDIFTRLEGLIG
jgi:hypothetical protein